MTDNVSDHHLDAIADEIRNAAGLNGLKSAIADFGAACIEAGLDVENEQRVRGVDMCALPTFGGAEPADTRSVWSWDATHLLVGEGAFDIVSREEWGLGGR